MIWELQKTSQRLRHPFPTRAGTLVPAEPQLATSQTCRGEKAQGRHRESSALCRRARRVLLNTGELRRQRGDAGSAETRAATAASSCPWDTGGPRAEAAGCVTRFTLCQWVTARDSPRAHLAGETGPRRRPSGSSLRTVYLNHAIDAPCNFSRAGAIANAILIYLSTDPLLHR